ncbi:helix-turn-helix domain-containing protein [Candidatus Methylobacter favarea]|nr:helix-turn-helix domain-containing protein [Candidatus Methylobacter favarea]
MRFTNEESTVLEDVIYKGKAAAHKRLHAQILLKADVSDAGEKRTDSEIGEALGLSTRTVERVRQHLVPEGLEATLNRAKPPRVRSRVIDGETEAHLIALAGTNATDVRSRWTLRLLRQRMVELGYVARQRTEVSRNRHPSESPDQPYRRRIAHHAERRRLHTRL